MVYPKPDLAYRSRLGAFVMHNMPGTPYQKKVWRIERMSAKEMCQRAMDDSEIWWRWNNKMQGQVYPTGDPRNPPEDRRWSELDGYRWHLGARIRYTLEQDPHWVDQITNMPTQEMLERARSDSIIWWFWYDEMFGFAYPPGDPRNPLGDRELRTIDGYRWHLGRAIRDTYDVTPERVDNILNMSNEDMLKRAMQDKSLWDRWESTTQQHAYPPGDSRNPTWDRGLSQELDAFRWRLLSTISHYEKSEFTWYGSDVDMSTDEILEWAKDDPVVWKAWTDQRGGYPYPNGDTRNPTLNIE